MKDHDSYKVVDNDTIKIKMFEGVARTLGDVNNFPNLEINLISWSTLDSKGTITLVKVEL